MTPSDCTWIAPTTRSPARATRVVVPGAVSARCVRLASSEYSVQPSASTRATSRSTWACAYGSITTSVMEVSAEPVDVLVLRDLADEFGAVAAQAGNDVVDVVDGEHDAAYAQRVRRRAFGLGSDRRRRVELRQLNPAVAVRGPHHGDVRTDAVESDGAVHRRPLDLRLAFQLHAELGEEHLGSLEVVDDDENVVHPLKRHRSPVFMGRACRGPSPGERSRSEFLDMVQLDGRFHG